MWLGFGLVEVVPSPKSHDHPVGDPVEESVNLTSSGAVPAVGVAEKPATGARGAGWIGRYLCQ